MVEIPRSEGRSAFGANPSAYHAGRPPYPSRVYEILESVCGLGENSSVFEVGPGSGVATKEILRRGAFPLVAIEPDSRFVEFLRGRHPEVRVVNATFEEADLGGEVFDLGISATAMHWIDENEALSKVAGLLRPGGFWAPWWNVFGDPNRHDAFHEATQDVFESPSSSPSDGDRGIPYALDHEARIGAMERAGLFDQIEYELRPWTLTLDTEGVCALYASYSNVARLAPDERKRTLDRLAEAAEKKFSGSVDRNMVTAIYTARRK